MGIKKQNGESQRDYIERVLESNIWNSTKDIATYDLSTEGAQELNTWVKAQPDVYYFLGQRKQLQNLYLQVIL